MTRYLVLPLLLLARMTGFSQDTTVQFKVYGLCEQCKHRIEESLKIKTIKAANWDVNKKLLTVSSAPSKITTDKIHTKIAAVGHDTNLKKASDAVYNALPSCCHYREMEK